MKILFFIVALLTGYCFAEMISFMSRSEYPGATLFLILAYLLYRESKGIYRTLDKFQRTKEARKRAENDLYADPWKHEKRDGC